MREFLGRSYSELLVPVVGLPKAFVFSFGIEYSTNASLMIGYCDFGKTACSKASLMIGGGIVICIQHVKQAS